LLRAGLKEARADVIFQCTYKADNSIVLTEELARTLLLAERNRIAFKIKDDCIEFGPYLGVFINEQKREKLLAGGWDSVYWRFQQWADEVCGIVFFFSLSGVNWQERAVVGYRWNEQKEWVAGHYPLPKVIYDRCFGRNGRKHSALLRQQLEHYNLPIVVYNSVAKFGKHEIYEHLSRYEELAPHIPFYAWYEPTLLLSLLEDNQTVYLKPDRLYKGKGVIRASRTEAGYTIELRQEQNVIYTFREAEAFLLQLESEMAEGQNYLMQKGINLATFLGNRYDLRVMLHKQAPDRWVVTGINARIAPVNSVITSPRSGGNVIYASAALAHSFPGKENLLAEEIKKFACAVGRALEERFGFLGELGVDLGFDQNGKLYLIEANAKPLKVSFSRIKDKALNKVINRTPIILGCTLAGFDFTGEKTYKFAGKEDVFVFKFLPYGPGWPKRILFLSTEQLKFFGYRPGQFVTLQIGFKKTYVEIGHLSF